MANQQSFLLRFLTYQKERFPFLANGLLIAAFSFSAISYSRLCRGAKGFIDLNAFFNCIFITITLFFLVRIFDEFKDKEDDAKYRSYLPVPRGLVTLQELKIAGIVAFVLQMIAIIAFQASLLPLFLIVFLYLCLMGKEFFIEHWLRDHQLWYVLSHMFIIPLVDVFASSYDWYLNDVVAPIGLIFFFIVSYCNGIVLEIGRKIKTPSNEEPGVKSYTFLLGTRKAVYAWLAMLTVTLVFAMVACHYAHHGHIEYIVLIALYVACSIPAFLFLQNSNNAKAAKWMEYTSALWTFGMYLCLGGVPMFIQLIHA
jgi:UbiA prenyltransferase family